MQTKILSRKCRMKEFKETQNPQNTNAWTDFIAKESNNLRLERYKMRISDFIILKKIGLGGYGQVYLAQKNGSNEVFALKKLNKAILAHDNEIEHTFTELDILSKTRTEWLVKLFYAFQDEDHIYLAMEYVPGGDFRTFLNKEGILNEDTAAFYISQMIMCVIELHKLGYIHRDIKPENFIIDSNGFLKLCDFGLSRLMDQQTSCSRKKVNSFVGSPDYMAFETLKNLECDHSVDFWSIGCIIYECLSGLPPFIADTPLETWENILNWQNCLKRQFHDRNDEIIILSDNAWDLINDLVTFPQDRITDLETFKSHPFFHCVCFEGLRLCQSPPFVPKLLNPLDTKYFDDFENLADLQISEMYKEVHEKHKDNHKKINQKSVHFIGFQYNHNHI